MARPRPVPTTLAAIIALTAAVPGAAQPAAPAEPAARDWRPFDERQRGVAASPAWYDAASIEWRGEGERRRLRVWVRDIFMLSGLPDWDNLFLYEIDCAGRRSRIPEMVENGGMPAAMGRAPRHARQRGSLNPIQPGSMVAALAAILCPADPAGPPTHPSQETPPS